MTRLVWYLFHFVLLVIAIVTLVYYKKDYRLLKRYVNEYESKANVSGQENQFPVSNLAIKYLCGLNGIEIGEARHNSFRLNNPKVCSKIGAFANVDFSVAQGNNWGPLSTVVNIVASGDSLPFKDNTLDYVISSHMIEHAFDPIRTIEEWFRVVKKGGYVFMIVPHKDRTFDKDREVTRPKELIARNKGVLKFSDYAADGKLSTGSILIKDKELPYGFERYTHDDHHHWSVWRTQDFIDLCVAKKWKIVESLDVDDKVGNGFLVILQK